MPGLGGGCRLLTSRGHESPSEGLIDRRACWYVGEGCAWGRDVSVGVQIRKKERVERRRKKWGIGECMYVKVWVWVWVV